jgi:hypothetical protein
MPRPGQTAFVETAEIALTLASSPEVATAWDAESACAGMSVGGLASHLLGQAVTTARLLEIEPGPEPIPLLEHYERAAWVHTGLDEEANVEIRTGSDERAAAGPSAILEIGRHAVERLPGLLAAPREPDTVFLDWQGWSLATDDFLATRLMEIVVHSDDLAVSVGLATPDFPEKALAPVLALLSGVAVRRHGQAAVVRALSRPQRAPASVSAF